MIINQIKPSQSLSSPPPPSMTGFDRQQDIECGCDETTESDNLEIPFHQWSLTRFVERMRILMSPPNDVPLFDPQPTASQPSKRQPHPQLYPHPYPFNLK